MLRKIIFAGTLIVLAFNSLFVTAQDKNFNLIPKAAVAGKQVTVSYNPKGTALEGKKCHRNYLPIL